jgi:hypothetical protein
MAIGMKKDWKTYKLFVVGLGTWYCKYPSLEVAKKKAASEAKKLSRAWPPHHDAWVTKG